MFGANAAQESHEIQVAKLEMDDGNNAQKLVVDFGQLKPMLQPYLDKKIAVLNIAGDFRTGKSFFMSLILRHLNWLSPSGPDLDERSFSFRAGSDRHTEGILFWPKPFVRKLPGDGGAEEYVLLLADTQGLSDNETDAQGDRLIFAFSTLMASAQILNIKKELTSTNVQMLDLFIKFAQSVSQGNVAAGQQSADEANNQLFQDLLILIRDWPSPGTNQFGFAGGEEYFRKFTEDQETSDEIRSHRDAINTAFLRIFTFLLPHPGDAAERPDFKGKIEDLEPEFVKYAGQLVEHMLGPNGVQRKILHGHMLTCAQWLEAMEYYGRIFGENSNLPPAQTMLQASAEIIYRLALNAAVAEYVNGMDEICNIGVNDDQLQNAHKLFLASSIEHFNEAKKMEAGPNIEQQFLANLEHQIQNLLPRFAQKNAQMREQRDANATLDGVQKEMRINLANANEERQRADERAKKRQEKMAEANENANAYEAMKQMLKDAIESYEKAKEEQEKIGQERLQKLNETVEGLKEQLLKSEQKMEEQRKEMARLGQEEMQEERRLKQIVDQIRQKRMEEQLREIEHESEMNRIRREREREEANKKDGCVIQ